MIINHVITNMTNTPFDNKHVKKLIDKYIRKTAEARFPMGPGKWIDPFARESFTTESDYFITNDLNSKMPTDYHMEFNEFAQFLYTRTSEDYEAIYYSGLLFDPPYTLRMLKDHYMDDNTDISDTIPLWQTQNMWGNGKDLIARRMELGSYAISFGYHTHGMGNHRGFQKKEILILEASGSPDRYDVLVTVEQKVQSTLIEQ
jgi:hypothetical protein